MPSFDIVSEVNWHEVSNAVDQANREVTTRFDFKGADASFTLGEKLVTMTTEADFQLKQMLDILNNKLIKRGIDLGFIDADDPNIQHKKATQVLRFKDGLSQEIAKKITKAIKNEKFKVQTQIQGEQVRVTGKKRDDLQAVIAYLKDKQADFAPMEYINFRD